MRCDALGMIEAKELVGSIGAADAIAEATNITLLDKEVIGGSLVTMMVRGGIDAIEAATNAGAAAAGEVGELVSMHVMLRPYGGVETTLPGTRASKQNITGQGTKIATRGDSIYKRRQRSSKS